MLKAEQARIAQERAQVEHWAHTAQHQIDDVTAALEEALLLLDDHQRAYDLAPQSQRRIINLAMFRQFTIREDGNGTELEPQLEVFYQELVDYMEAYEGSDRAGHSPASAARRPQPAALAAVGAGSGRAGHDANPSPISWGRSSHSDEMAEREGFEPSDEVSPVTRFPVAPVQPLRHLSRVCDAQGYAKR